MKRIIPILLAILLAVTLGLTWETSFRRVAVPDSKGRQTKAILTLSDDHKAIEVHPAKGVSMSIP